MPDPNLTNYIAQSLASGLSRGEIKKNLLAQGWQEQDAEAAFSQGTASSVPPKKRKWKKVVLVVVGVLVFLGAGIYFLPTILGFFTKDVPPIDDSDLQFQRVSVPDSENAYFDLIELGGTALEPKNVIYEPEGKSQMILDMAAGKIWDEQLAEELIARNAQGFEYFSAAARKPKFQDPAQSDPSKITPYTVLPSMNSWRRMARLSAIRALYLAKRGADAEALEEALNAVKIGQKVQESQATLVEFLVATAMKGTGLEATRKIIITSRLNSAELGQYARELDQFYRNENGLASVFKGEYRLASWAIDDITAKGIKRYIDEGLEEVEQRGLPVDKGNDANIDVLKLPTSNYYWRPNETKELFADHVREQIKKTTQPCDEIKEVEMLKLTPSSFAGLYVTENAIGKILYDIVATSLTTTFQKKCEEDLLVAATQALFVIKAFKTDTGNYPASLQELVPRYLSAVPQDSFDGKPLKYSAEKRVLYSVGKDGKDSGGSTGDDWRQMVDPTFAINF